MSYYKGYAPKRPQYNTVSVLPSPYSPEPNGLVFSPDAMVRNPSPPPIDVTPGRLYPNGRGGRGREHSRTVSRDDSRVQGSIDDGPDPAMPLEPLRLETKEGKW